jgi:valyl-tRNA synthetase
VPILRFQDRLLGSGEELSWHPAHMGARYRSWVENLNQDWCISRQRFFGVPFPCGIASTNRGPALATRNPLYADEGSLPIDPQEDVPPGFTAEQRGIPGGFTGDPDVMDTWATSSLTPQIAAKWEEDPTCSSGCFPMDLRPQAHDIIRTWLFYTVYPFGDRARIAAVVERGDQRVRPGPGSQEDVEVQGERGRADRGLRATFRRRRPVLGQGGHASGSTPPSTRSR